MKVLLVALNSQFVHSSLSVHSLYAAARGKTEADIIIKEYTINQEEDLILRGLAGEDPDLVCFSCYIWNIAMVGRLSENLKKIDSSIKILLGGPEVSYSSCSAGYRLPKADYVLPGEGEENFTRFLSEGKTEESIAVVENLDSLMFPYSEKDFEEAEDKILYYESSRGCPYRCSYCLSSTIKNTRFKSIEKTKSELDIFLTQRVKQVKFVDRTFNADKARAVEIMRHLIRNDNGRTNFHFEINGDLIDEAFIDAVSDSRKSLFQFEIGVQSTCEKTLKAVNRTTDFEKLSLLAGRLIATGKCHVHLDLIAALPYEDYGRFKKSFNDVHGIGGHHLQLGFLKLLPGTQIREQANLYGYEYKAEPPYEVLKSHVLPYEDISRLKKIEDVLERYGNSGGFTLSVGYLINLFDGDAFGFYETLSEYLEGFGFFSKAHHKRKLYGYLYDFYRESEFEKEENLFLNLLKFDYLRQKPQNLLPIFTRNEPHDYRNRCHLFLQDEDAVKRYLPACKGLAAKNIMKKVHFEPFEFNVYTMEKEETHILYDYGSERGLMGESACHVITLPQTGKEGTDGYSK